jgi:hypothetical protein
METLEVVLDSPLKLWWLQLQGYKVIGKTLEPKQTMFGRIRYVNHWRLTKSQQTD